jgi:alkylation response protein AidB-like acyl-CoA dehydrogenase
MARADHLPDESHVGKSILEHSNALLCVRYMLTPSPPVLKYKDQAKNLSGPIGLLKTYCTRSAHEVADEATNIFGGRGITQGGMGRVVEMFHRTYKFDAILGGAEEVLADLGVRQAMRFMPNAKL